MKVHQTCVSQKQLFFCLPIDLLSSLYRFVGRYWERCSITTTLLHVHSKKSEWGWPPFISGGN